MSITKEMMEKLLSVGFRFEEFEGHLESPGEVFFYNGVEHTIGGRTLASGYRSTYALA